jgi:hypothetical protein
MAELIDAFMQAVDTFLSLVCSEPLDPVPANGDRRNLQWHSLPTIGPPFYSRLLPILAGRQASMHKHLVKLQGDEHFSKVPPEAKITLCKVYFVPAAPKADWIPFTLGHLRESLGQELFNDLVLVNYNVEQDPALPLLYVAGNIATANEQVSKVLHADTPKVAIVNGMSFGKRRKGKIRTHYANFCLKSGITSCNYDAERLALYFLHPHAFEQQAQPKLAQRFWLAVSHSVCNHCLSAIGVRVGEDPCAFASSFYQDEVTGTTSRLSKWPARGPQQGARLVSAVGVACDDFPWSKEDAEARAKAPTASYWTDHVLSTDTVQRQSDSSLGE